MPDQFTNYYSDYLDATYDCVDRIVLNAYSTLACSPGGFRKWWRRLQGTDDDLNNTSIKRFAGRMGRRIYAYAKKNRIPIKNCKAGQRKHEIAEQHIPEDPEFSGLFLIIGSRAPNSVYNIDRSGESGKIINIVKKKPMPYVKHYSFHIIDPEWGHITIKLCGHPPFNAQIILNGHEYVERKAKEEGIVFTKEGNCFTDIDNARHLGLVAETSSERAIGRLAGVCERWIYSACLCFALTLKEQERSGFRYQYSVYQAEYSRNLLFTRGKVLDQVFKGLVAHSWPCMDINRVKTIFGYKKRPAHKRSRKSRPRLEMVIERPVYDMTVFKLHFGAFTVKFYTKGEHVLRAEAVLHNARALNCRRSVGYFPELINRLKNILDNVMEAVNCIDVSWIDDGSFDQLSTPSSVGKSRVAGVNLNKERIRTVMGAIISLAPNPRGFTASELALAVNKYESAQCQDYTSGKASYDLRKFRGKNLVRKIENSRRYKATQKGLRAMVAILTLREQVIKPILAATAKPIRRQKAKNQHPVNHHYHNIQLEMRELFNTIGLAA